MKSIRNGKKKTITGVCCILLTLMFLSASGCAGSAPQQGADRAGNGGAPQETGGADAGAPQETGGSDAGAASDQTGADASNPSANTPQEGTAGDQSGTGTGAASDQTGAGASTPSGDTSGDQPGTGTDQTGAGASTPAGASQEGTADDMETAKNAALEHAGFQADQVTFVKTKLDYDDGVAEYDIEFVTDTDKYEYEVRQSDFAILKSSHEKRSYSVHHNTDGHSDPHDAGMQNLITDEEAVAAALAHAGLTEDEAVYLELELEYDDGRYEYEIDFYAGNMEYGYKVDATDGTILEAESEKI